MKPKTHVCSIRLGEEEYGWIVRYCEKNDLSISAVIRKSLKMYRAALTQKAAAKRKDEG